jgi:integrase/recombinase XerD
VPWSNRRPKAGNERWGGRVPHRMDTTKLGHDENQSFIALGIEPQCWATATPIRQIFKEAFQDAGLPYFHPHLFRTTLTHQGQQVCRTPEQFKAWSQNLGHDDPLTTFTSYGKIDPYRQGEVIKGLSRQQPGQDMLREMYDMMKNGQITPAQGI